jgi:hypothetical protein
MREYEYDIQEFNNNLFAYINCYRDKCKYENEILKTETENLGTLQLLLRNKYEKGELTYKKYIRENIKAYDNYYYSINHKNLTKCKLDNCYDLAKKNLDGMLKRMGYPTRKNYNVNNVIKILKLNNINYVYPYWEIK